MLEWLYRPRDGDWLYRPRDGDWLYGPTDVDLREAQVSALS